MPSCKETKIKPQIMKKIVLLRHGESVWNRENRFTGWTDIDLTKNGIQEAYMAGKLLSNNGFEFQMAFTSYLKRAIKTLDCILDAMDKEWIPVEKSWRLNEKHYGALQGLNKNETAAKYGEKQVLIWRRSYDTAPLPLAENDPRNPRFDPRYRDIPPCMLPLTESLKDTVARILPYWKERILPAAASFDQILVVAHGNSLRAIIKMLKNITDDDIMGLNIPTAIPCVFEFDDKMHLQRDYFLGDDEQIRRSMAAVAAQGRIK